LNCYGSLQEQHSKARLGLHVTPMAQIQLIVPPEATIGANGFSSRSHEPL
jgi:hypothetical protein